MAPPIGPEDWPDSGRRETGGALEAREQKEKRGSAERGETGADTAVPKEKDKEIGKRKFIDRLYWLIV